MNTNCLVPSGSNGTDGGSNNGGNSVGDGWNNGSQRGLENGKGEDMRQDTNGKKGQSKSKNDSQYASNHGLSDGKGRNEGGFKSDGGDGHYTSSGTVSVSGEGKGKKGDTGIGEGGRTTVGGYNNSWTGRDNGNNGGNGGSTGISILFNIESWIINNVFILLKVHPEDILVLKRKITSNQRERLARMKFIHPLPTMNGSEIWDHLPRISTLMLR